MNYDEYVNEKRITQPASGFDVALADLNPKMFDYQKSIAQWSLRRGKAAIFAACGLGKSLMEWQFAKAVSDRTDTPVLMLAPLAVNKQMVRECGDFGYTINDCRTRDDVKAGLNVTNYERLHKFSPEDFSGIIADESSILKGGSLGIISNEIVDFASVIPYRLAATATPAPNDFDELIFHAVFLGIMTESECKALFFTQDGNSSNKMRLKRYAEQEFWKWMASWAVAIRTPSDLGFDNTGYELPPINIQQTTIDPDDAFENGTLFAMAATGISEQRKARKNTLEARTQAVAELVNTSNEQWLVWCDLNDESKALTKAIRGAIEVTGSDSEEHKEDAVIGFIEGRYRVLVSKPKILGFGMNFQNSHNMAFCGLGNSYEQYHQAIKRQHRFGQKSTVNVHVFVSSADGSIVENIQRKEAQHDETFGQIAIHMNIYTDLGASARSEMDYKPQLPVNVPSWLQPVTKQAPPRDPSDVHSYQWLDLDAIPFQIEGIIKSPFVAVEATQAMITPSWL